VARGLADDRDIAARLILAAQMRVGLGDGARTNLKPGELVADDAVLSLVERAPYVSRRRSTLSASRSPAESASTSAHRPAASPMSC